MSAFPPGKTELLLLLLLLTDADFVDAGLHVAVGLPVKALGSFLQVSIDIGTFGQYSHQGGMFGAVGARQAVAFYVGNRHRSFLGARGLLYQDNMAAGVASNRGGRKYPECLCTRAQNARVAFVANASGILETCA